MMPILLIETSTERAIIGIVNGNTLLFQKELPLGLNNAKFLAPTVEEALISVGLDMSLISMIAVGVGPGSYTGIRAGAMLAKALAFGAQCPLVGICTLECFVPSVDGSFTVLIDARIGGAYCIAGIKEKGSIRYTLKPQVIPLDNLESILKDVHHIVTPQSKVLKLKLDSHCPDAVWEECSPNLVQMALVAEKNRNNGESSIDEALELMYLRKTGAELEKEIKKRAIDA